MRLYIQGQEEHHRLEPFEGEYRRFLEENGIPYDERSIFD